MSPFIRELEAAALTSNLPPSAKQPISRLSVLIVDDDRVLLETTAAMLDEEFDIRTASSGDDALTRLTQEPCQVVCADYMMPGLDGAALLRRVHELYPGTSGILVTGLRDQLPRGLAQDESIFAIVYKPYAADTLFRTIRDAAKLAAMTRAVTNFGRSSQRLGRR